MTPVNNNQMSELEEQIKEIINMKEEPNESLFVDFKPATLKEYQTRCLTNLLKQQREEAVKGFVNAYEKHERDILKLDMGNIDHSFVETYLSQPTEGYASKKDYEESEGI